ncbi:hypothetical protein [Paraclostridium sordellii]|uniref:hypothetical protein n=1 Tax=Paraclostridium sordellii TaxID=1505 RepID=UPI0022E65883|nr:hypothetical protein [Paeniclostridium sordellii]
MENINDLIEKYLNEVISIRRNIHQNSELSLKEFKYSYGYPITYNDENFTHKVIKSLQNNLGFDNVEIPNYPTTCGEDFIKYGIKALVTTAIDYLKKQFQS